MSTKQSSSAVLESIAQVQVLDRKEQRFRLVLIFALIGLLGLSLTLNIIQFNHTPEAEVVMETEDGRIRPLPTIDQALFTDSEVIDWTARHLELAYKLAHTDVSNYASHLRSFMSEKAAEDFYQGVLDAGLIDIVVREKRIMQGKRVQAPVLMNKGISPAVREGQEDRYVWNLTMPIVITMASTAHEPQKRMPQLKLNVTVGRVHAAQNRDKLIIGAVSVRRDQN